MAEILEMALNALKKEIEKEPMSPERVTALVEAIKALSDIKPLLM